MQLQRSVHLHLLLLVAAAGLQTITHRITYIVSSLYNVLLCRKVSMFFPYIVGSTLFCHTLL